MGTWSPLEMFCLLSGLVVWAVVGVVSVRLVLAHRRVWPPETVEHEEGAPALPTHARLAALDALRSHGRIGADEHAARRRALLLEASGRSR
ncbi:hypothetical protein [Luteimonas sp. 9C]|uniref:hypothetical protein n=1 Tax=Luteimonas sp. 9C TaxID=2653148 RepID=UPI00135AF99B|nr:hypothetical protein [Luteimonas sp. 9C]